MPSRTRKTKICRRCCDCDAIAGPSASVGGVTVDPTHSLVIGSNNTSYLIFPPGDSFTVDNTKVKMFSTNSQSDTTDFFYDYTVTTLSGSLSTDLGSSFPPEQVVTMNVSIYAQAHTDSNENVQILPSGTAKLQFNENRTRFTIFYNTDVNNELIPTERSHFVFVVFSDAIVPLNSFQVEITAAVSDPPPEQGRIG